jgi:hypothetical protein
MYWRRHTDCILEALELSSFCTKPFSCSGLKEYWALGLSQCVILAQRAVLLGCMMDERLEKDGT